MSDTPNLTEPEPPLRPDEIVLADFLDEALRRDEQGRDVPVVELLRDRPELVAEAEQLLADARAMRRAGPTAGQALLLDSDLADLVREAVPAPPDEAPRPDPLPDRYRVQRPLGRGHFSTVWLADDLLLSRPVALKAVRPADSPEQDRARWGAVLDEARKVASLHHRNVVQIYDCLPGQSPAAAGYLVLEYVPGGSLAHRVEEEGPLPWQRAARYLADVAEGLRHIHRLGLIHRDIKPGNILWDERTDEALLTDLGVATRLADPGNVAGTPLYMAPEAFDGHVGFALDVYGLTATLFCLVTGSAPFPGPTLESVRTQARRGLDTGDPRCGQFPRELEELIRRGLAADPERRPGPEEFATVLRGTLNQLLADTLLLTPDQPPVTPLRLHLSISRQMGSHTFAPLATTRPAPERRTRDLKRVPPRPERVVARTGERLRLEVDTDRGGYLTVFNVGPTGNLNLLYPAELSAASLPAAVEPGRPLHMLDIELTPPAGRERVFALWTARPLALRLDEMLQLVTRGELTPSRSYRATRDLVRVQESVRRLEAGDWHVAVLELEHTD
jgi:serine/threonine-protein kinase